MLNKFIQKKRKINLYNNIDNFHNNINNLKNISYNIVLNQKDKNIKIKYFV